MKNYFLITLVILATAVSCKKEVTPTPPTTKDSISVVSQFVYDGMSDYYLWASEMTSKKPTLTDKDPEAYFKTLLNATDTQHGWSWITDDIDGLLADFSGTPLDFGWSLSLLWVDAAKTRLVGIVKYVYPNTPASNAGIVRGNIIDTLDGASITLSNYEKLYSNNAITVKVKDQNFSNGRTIAISPITIEANPILKDTVYNIGGHKIGYLFYSEFTLKYNSKLFETFTKFKAAGVTDLVVDLRYNHGGSISAATYLGSLIAPQTVVQNKSAFTILSYNSFLNQYFDQNSIDRKEYLGELNGAPDPMGANLNLNKVYVIATGDSYSASELLTFCLKPYMSVVHIGGNTGGKFTASITIHAYNSYNNRVATIYNESAIPAGTKASLKNWGMQPIVAKYTDKDGKDFVSPGYLVPTEPMTSLENNPSVWKPIGDVQDYLLAKAVSLITGVPVSGAVNANTIPRSAISGYKDAKLFGPIDDKLKESVHLNPPK